MVLFDKLVLHQMLDAVNQHLEQLRSARRQCSHEETQNQDEVLLWDMLLAPSNEAVVCSLVSKH